MQCLLDTLLVNAASTTWMQWDVRAELEAVAGALRRPAWRVLVDAIRAYVGTGPTLSEDERRVIRAVVKLHER